MADSPYESTKLLGEYLLFHYGKRKEILPWEQGPFEALDFPRRTVESLMAGINEFNPHARALDIGCAVGGSTFVLGKYFGEVLGIDLSQNFIAAANKLKEKKSIDYDYQVEGDHYIRARAIPVSCEGKIDFEVGDAMNLPCSLTDYDLVHAANVICRLPNPKKFLLSVSQMIKHGGQLLLATPFTWLEKYTSPSEWLGSGDSKEKLQELLRPWFQLEHEEDLPFLIREHKRKYQYSISWGTRWRRI